MIIILEGENKTGKSTICNYIVDHYDFDYVKCSQPKGDPYVEYMEILRRIEKSGKNTVIDRFLYGEFVYGPIYRGKSLLTETQKRNIELKALSLNAHLIYCYDTVKNIKQRFLSEGEEFAKTKLIGETLRRFDEVIHNAIIPTTFHQMKTKDDLVMNEIVLFHGPQVTGIHYDTPKKLKDTKKTVKLDTLINQLGYWDNFKHLKTAVGDQQRPMVVLVGERRNEKLHPEYKRYHQPFDFGVSAEYLFNELKRADVPIGRVMFMNSDSRELKFINEYFDVVALGRVASQRLQRAGYNHYHMNHPSYERRFHGKKHRLAKTLGDIVWGDDDDDCDC